MQVWRGLSFSLWFPHAIIRAGRHCCLYCGSTLLILCRLCGQSSYQRSLYESTNLSTIPQQMSPEASETGFWFKRLETIDIGKDVNEDSWMSLKKQQLPYSTLNVKKILSIASEIVLCIIM